jgi:hypothetical protein
VGYQVVQVESQLSNQAREMNLAMSVAEAGLQRFLGEHRGHPPDTTFYSINAGQAMVVTRKLAEISNLQDLYLISSHGTYADPRYSDSPATRTVHQHAVLTRMPFTHLAALTHASSQNVTLRSPLTVSGVDAATPGSCPEAGLSTLAGSITAGGVVLTGGIITGTPPADTLASAQAVLDTVAARWDIISDETYPVDRQSNGNWVGYMSGLPADSFPVVRADRDLRADWSEIGRGVLIVPGILTIRRGFQWDGIILAGRLASTGARSFAPFDIRGILISGLDAEGGAITLRYGTLQYHSCNIMAAGYSLAHLEPVSNTWWEAY